ncbi:anti-virulence regulator CigR family protein [Tistrella mobilis]
MSEHLFIRQRPMARRLAVLAISLIALPGVMAGAGAFNSALADPPPHAKGGGPKQDKDERDHRHHHRGPDQDDRRYDHRHDDRAPALINVNIITGDERRIITDYVGHHHGQFGYEPLPPGIARNLARGKPLPPGIAKKRLPPPLYDRLPRREGYEWIQAGRDILLIAAATGVIVDILNNAVD